MGLLARSWVGTEALTAHPVSLPGDHCSGGCPADQCEWHAHPLVAPSAQ